MAAPLAARLLALAACAGAAPLRQTEWQKALLKRVVVTAEARSREATPALLERLASPDVRAELQACSPEAAALPAHALAERLRREVRAAEVISGFTAKGWPYRMSLKEVIDAGYFENDWEASLRQGFNYSNLPGFNWFMIEDGVETGLYGLRPFSRLGAPKTMAEASERAPYTLVNLIRADGGSQLYGDLSVVFANEIAAEASVVSSVDTGGWTALCNSTDQGGKFPFGPWPPAGYKANCSAYKNFSGLGTLRHFDHLFLMNEAYWNASIARVACRLLAPWGHYPIRGTDLFHYWEALPAAKLEYPSSIKFVIATFGSLFGTALGERVQRWCTDNGWVLVWSLGLNNQTAPNFWTAANLTWPFTSNRRLADPLVLAKTTAGANVSINEQDRSAFLEAWSKANVSRRAARAAKSTVANTTWASAWDLLAQALPASLHLTPLSAGACGDIDSCVGVTAEGSCLCYQRAPIDLVV